MTKKYIQLLNLPFFTISLLFFARLSALDPAFPLFYGTFSYHLSKHDAEFVDVIHTDAWIYGAPVSTGTADFWPNGGTTLQPGCPKRNYKLLSDNGGFLSDNASHNITISAFCNYIIYVSVIMYYYVFLQ